MAEEDKTVRKPGVAFPWEEKLKELGEIRGDAELIKKV